MALKDGIKMQDHVVVEMVDCTPEQSVEERAFRAGYQAALRLNYPGQIGAEDRAWHEWRDKQ